MGDCGADFVLADEESFQRILNQGLSQELQQGGLGVRKFWILDFGFWVNFRQNRIAKKDCWKQPVG
jgi:hypothetical protein